MRRTRGAPAGPPRPRSDPPQEVDRDRRTPGPLWVPYLGRFALRRGSRLFTLDGRSHPVEPARAPIFDAALLGGCDLGDLSVRVSRQAGLAPAEGFRRMRDALQRPENLLRAFPYAGPRSFDVVLVDQGYGGVWVNTVEIWKELRRRGVEALLISPVDPLFESQPESAYLFTWERVCRRHPLSYFSFINLVRNLLKLLSFRLLFIGHRSQSLYLSDLVPRQRTVIYCDGYYDSRFNLGNCLGVQRPSLFHRRVVEEVLYILGCSQSDFTGFLTNPAANFHLMLAGWFALRHAWQNWAWTAGQAQDLRESFPRLAGRVRFVPPFVRETIFDPSRAARERGQILFTTTMHNIEKKGFRELLRALPSLPETTRVRCVVRYPELLPAIPPRAKSRVDIATLPKDQMIEAYHRCWVYCRVSREESTPLSLMEAMACELPVIVSPLIARNFPVLEDGKTGYIVDPDDTRLLAARLKSLLSNAGLRDAMGREARQRVLEFSLEKQIHPLLAAIQ